MVHPGNKRTRMTGEHKVWRKGIRIMRNVDTAYLSQNECWGVQINGLKHCQNCKWIGISACEGKDIRLIGYNSKGFRIGEDGIIVVDYNKKYDKSPASV